MTSTLDQSGLTIESQTQIVADLVAGFQAIYGADINVLSNSPDGQLINILAQADSDQLELLLRTYNNFAVDTSSGTRLDQLVALNGLARILGTFTIAQINVTATQAVSIPGMADVTLVPFTVADSAGNQFQLIGPHTFSGPGTALLVFQAVTLGAVQTSANTITRIVTPTFGISTVNNPSVSSDIIGIDEETDAQLRIRHAQSFQLASTGPSDSVEAALKQVPGVLDAYVFENATGSPLAGVPAYSIWAIVTPGTATAAAIAQAIYSKKGVGSPMFGSQSSIVSRPNGQSFTAKWDDSISQTLYVAFSLIWRGAVLSSNADIATALSAALLYKLGQNPSIGDVITAMQVIAPTAIVTINPTTQGVSLNNSTWGSTVAPTDPQHYFGSVNINIT